MTRQMAMALLYILEKVTDYSNDEMLNWNRIVIVDIIEEIVTGISDTA